MIAWILESATQKGIHQIKCIVCCGANHCPFALFRHSDQITALLLCFVIPTAALLSRKGVPVVLAAISSLVIQRHRQTKMPPPKNAQDIQAYQHPSMAVSLTTAVRFHNLVCQRTSRTGPRTIQMLLVTKFKCIISCCTLYFDFLTKVHIP